MTYLMAWLCAVVANTIYAAAVNGNYMRAAEWSFAQGLALIVGWAICKLEHHD